MNRQKQLLAALLVVFVLSVVYAWQRAPRQQTAPAHQAPASIPRPRPTPTATPATAPAAAELTPPQPLALPEPERREVVVKQNLFIPLQVAEAQIAVKKAAAIKPPPPPPPPPPPTPQQRARTELAQYRSLGLLKKQGKLIAFLSRDGQIRLVRIGDSLITGYTVTEINDNQILMRAADGDQIFLGLR